MGGGGSKEDTHARVKSKLKHAVTASAFQSGYTYTPDPKSKSLIVLHVQPGSNDITTDWLKLDEASGIVTPNKFRKSKTIPILKRVANGGGSVDDIILLKDAASIIAKASSRTRSIVLVVDVLTVEGQALLKHFWFEHDWLKKTNATIVLILPTFSDQPAGTKTTHPSLYGPAWAPFQATVALGIDFGMSFLKGRKKKSQVEAAGTRVAFVPRHTWYGSRNPIHLIAAHLVSRLNLRCKIRDEWEKKILPEGEVYDDVDSEMHRIKGVIAANKIRRAELSESIQQRQIDRENQRVTQDKAESERIIAAAAAQKVKDDASTAAQNASEKEKDEWLTSNEEEPNYEAKVEEQVQDLHVFHQTYAFDGEAAGPWTAHLDATSGHFYYLNSITGESSWHRPADYDVAAALEPEQTAAAAAAAVQMEPEFEDDGESAKGMAETRTPEPAKGMAETKETTLHPDDKPFVVGLFEIGDMVIFQRSKGPKRSKIVQIHPIDLNIDPATITRADQVKGYTIQMIKKNKLKFTTAQFIRLETHEDVVKDNVGSMLGSSLVSRVNASATKNIVPTAGEKENLDMDMENFAMPDDDAGDAGGKEQEELDFALPSEFNGNDELEDFAMPSDNAAQETAAEATAEKEAEEDNFLDGLGELGDMDMDGESQSLLDDIVSFGMDADTETEEIQHEVVNHEVVQHHEGKSAGESDPYEGEQAGPWTAHLDPASAHFYYLHGATHETVWERPADFGDAPESKVEVHQQHEPYEGEQAGPWTAHLDPASGHFYYLHGATHETVWERPADFGDAPESKVDVHQQQFEHFDPYEGEQAGPWTAHLDPASAHFYYLHGATHETVWERPPEYAGANVSNHLVSNYASTSSRPPPTMKRSTTPENILEQKYQNVQANNETDTNEAEKSIETQWAEIALKNARRKKKYHPRSLPKRPDCEIVYHAASQPEHYSAFLTTSFERLVLHNNAFSSQSSVTPENLELSITNLQNLWPSTWKYVTVEGEEGDDDQFADDHHDEDSCVEAGTPAEFERSYCKHLPLGDIGCWPSGDVILAGAGTNAAKLVQMTETVTGASAYDGHNTHVRQNIKYVLSLEHLTMDETWKSGDSDCILVVDSEDSPEKVLEFLKTQSELKSAYKKNLGASKHGYEGETAGPWTAYADESSGHIYYLHGHTHESSWDRPPEYEVIDAKLGNMPPSIIIALLLPSANGNDPQWANAAQIFAMDTMYPDSIDLMVLMQSGLSKQSASCLNIMARCPVDLSSVCKHMSPFPLIHHAIGFVASSQGKTGTGEIGCLVDTPGLTGETEDGVTQQGMTVYVSYSIYSGPGGYAEGFCVEGDAPDSPRNVISQIIGTTHHLSPVANAGYGISSVSGEPDETDSVWGVLATIPSTMQDVLMRCINASNTEWDINKMEKQLTAIADLRNKYLEFFPFPPSDGPLDDTMLR